MSEFNKYKDKPKQVKIDWQREVEGSAESKASSYR